MKEQDAAREGFADGPHVLGAVTLLARLVQDELGPRLGELGLTFAETVAMVRLWQAPGGTLGQSDLIEKLAVSRASGSLVLSDLERSGFITRSIDPTDARRQVVALSEKGRAAESAVHSEFEALESRLFDPIGSDAWKTTYGSLRSAIESLLVARNGDE
ncbi:MAG: MarR family transcriptional regulator [Acidimicrobiia bacterium]|nr:MarR family transcriptional regulator [Acidimicrobiia bacterium]